MKNRLVLVTTLLLATLAPLPAVDDAALVSARGKLLFADDFDRTESTLDKEDIGGGWTSNSGWRAKGHKQVSLIDGAMQVVKHAEADHGVAIFHDAAFQDGTVQMKFKLGAGDEIESRRVAHAARRRGRRYDARVGGRHVRGPVQIRRHRASDQTHDHARREQVRVGG